MRDCGELLVTVSCDTCGEVAVKLKDMTTSEQTGVASSYQCVCPVCGGELKGRFALYGYPHNVSTFCRADVVAAAEKFLEIRDKGKSAGKEGASK